MNATGKRSLSTPEVHPVTANVLATYAGGWRENLPAITAQRSARADPDVWRRIAQEVATAYTRHGCWPDGSPMVSERVITVLSTSVANVSAWYCLID